MVASLKLERGGVLPFALTEDQNVINEAARAIVEGMPSKYKPARIATIKDTIRTRMSGVSDDEIERIFLKSVYDYWAYGIKIEEEFYYGLLNKTHEERKEYITYMEHIIYAFKLNNRDKRDLLYHKYKTYEFFKEFYKRDVILINGNEDEYEAFKSFATLHPTFIVKPIDCHMGEGVHKETVIDGDFRAVFDRICQSCKDNKELYNAKVDGAVLEEIFDQDERMGAFHTGGVSDVRCTTIRVGDEVTVFYPWLSTGRDGRFLTPYAEGRIVAGINAQTGVVETDGHTEGGKIYTHHPNSGLRYKGFKIPEWDALLDTVKAAALKLDDITYIGFDMVLTKCGWAIQEANFAGEPVWQMLYGYGTKKEFESIIGWSMTKEFWWQEDVKTFS